MDRQIPIYFDNVIIASPIQQVSETNPNLGRLQVGVFTKYGNRNGSYITDEVAEMLISSATKGDTPVIGFFDPETKSWASHTGPTLASAYGYVQSFNGWSPLTDTDGETRDYAIFTVVIFTKYFEEAKMIVGQNQSMELDIKSINGDWADINGTEYFVYTTAAIQGLCVIGSHEPCFSVSSFFSKDDTKYKSQYEKFSSLLYAAKAQVEEAENNKKGGEQPMEEFEKTVETVEEETVETTPEKTEFEQKEEKTTEVIEGITQEEEQAPSEFEVLQQQFNDLQASYDELKKNYDEAQNHISELESFQATANQELEDLRSKNEELQSSIFNYENQLKQVEIDKKDALVEKYEKVINEEIISQVREQISNYTYDELESKLAIVFANQKMAEVTHEEKVPLPDPVESQFALLMKKYRKN